MKTMTAPLPTGGAARVDLPDTATGQDLRTVSAVLSVLADWWDKRHAATPVIPALPAIQDLLPH